MLKKHIVFSLIFLIIAILQLIGTYFSLVTLKTYTIPFLTTSLGIYLIQATSLKGRFHRRVLTGLVFSLIADLLLQTFSADTSYFIYGLAAFAIAHLFYTSAFYLDFKSAPELDKTGARWSIIICAFISILFFYYLRPHLGAMRVPVLGYTLIISFMVMMAAFRHMRVNALSFMLIIAGACIFMLSDAVFAYNYFVVPFKTTTIISLATYMLAQFLITIGAVERQLINKG